MAVDQEPSIQSVVDAACMYYHDAAGKNRAGGVFHIVLDDGNIETDHIMFCLEGALEELDVDALKLGVLLLAMSEAQREELVNEHYACYSGAGEVRHAGGCGGAPGAGSIGTGSL